MPSDVTIIHYKEDKFYSQQASFYIIQNWQWLNWVSQIVIFICRLNVMAMRLDKRRLRGDGWDSANSAYQWLYVPQASLLSAHQR